VLHSLLAPRHPTAFLHQLGTGPQGRRGQCLSHSISTPETYYNISMLRNRLSAQKWKPCQAPFKFTTSLGAMHGILVMCKPNLSPTLSQSSNLNQPHIGNCLIFSQHVSYGVGGVKVF
jgi:hypothetical protein